MKGFQISKGFCFYMVKGFQITLRANYYILWLQILDKMLVYLEEKTKEITAVSVVLNSIQKLINNS